MTLKYYSSFIWPRGGGEGSAWVTRERGEDGRKKSIF